MTDTASDVRGNRWVMPALILSLLGSVPPLLVSFLRVFSIPDRWFGGADHFFAWSIFLNVFSLLCLSAAMAGLIMGVVAIVQIRSRPGTAPGKGKAVAAIAIVLGAMLLMRLVWIGSSIVGLFRTW